jgi:hypothetical protein
LATVPETGSAITPTEFTAAIMDNSLGFPAQLYTTAPDQASLVTLNLNSSNTIANVGTYSTLLSANGTTTVTGVTGSVSAVPEPSTTAAIMGGAVAILALGARRFRKTQTA